MLITNSFDPWVKNFHFWLIVSIIGLRFFVFWWSSNLFNVFIESSIISMYKLNRSFFSHLMIWNDYTNSKYINLQRKDNVSSSQNTNQKTGSGESLTNEQRQRGAVSHKILLCSIILVWRHSIRRRNVAFPYRSFLYILFV
jgi:hypothetical protein